MSDTSFARTFPVDRLQAAAANTPRRTMHGSGGWTLPSRFETLRQPQDQDGAVVNSAVSASTLVRPIDGRSFPATVEANDARLNGSTRSLAYRTKGLNIRPAKVSDFAQVETPGLEPVVRKLPATSRKRTVSSAQVA